MRLRITSVTVFCVISLVCGGVSAQQAEPPKSPATPAPQAGGSAQTPPPSPTPVFDMGKIVVVGKPDGPTGLGGVVITPDQIWTFDRNSLDQAVNIAPGVSSQLDSNGRRNESDIFVRGFGRWQVPLMLDGVRIYLPADNRLDFARFLTGDIAEVQIQKGYASVLDGPGAMGGAINLVTRKPVKAFEAEGSAEVGGRSAGEAWNGYAMVGTRQDKYYMQGSANFSDRDFWTLSGNYQPTSNSLQPSGRRLNSDSSDSRYNVKVGFTPNATDEYTVNYIKQNGEKGAPLNVLTNPPVPPNSYWRWPYWDIQNTSILTRTQLGATSYVKGKVYANQFKNGLDAFDDATYTTQSANGRFSSPYDDHAIGGGAEFGSTQGSKNTIKGSIYYRTDVHKEQNFNRPTHPTLSFLEPIQAQSLNTWSVAAENTFDVRPDVDVVGGVSYEKYDVTKAQEFNAATGLFELPKGGSDSFNWQGAVIWRYSTTSQIHAGVSDRSRFPVLFELYSTRFGTATPNPNLGPERATNLDVGWKTKAVRSIHVETAIFYSDVRDLIQTVVLPNGTTQTQNVGTGTFYGAEVGANGPMSDQLTVGANYTYLHRTIHDGLQPNLRPTGVPTHKAFVYASWKPIQHLTITPSLDVAGDRWSDMMTAPVSPFPYVRTGAYTLFNLAAEYSVAKTVSVAFGFKNMNDDNYALSWGLPQPGRTFYLKTRLGF